jgi:hypothetical protein
MQSGKKDDIEKPDLFSLEVGKRMREHRMEVDPEIWEALEGKLSSRKKRILPYWALSAAAVVVLLVGVLLFLMPPINDAELELTQAIPGKSELVQPHSNFQKEDVNTLQKEEITSSPQLFAQRSSPQKQQKTDALLVELKEEISDIDNVVEEESVPAPVDEVSMDELFADTGNVLPNQDEDLSTLLLTDDDLPLPAQNEDKHPIAFLLAMGSGDGLPDVSFGDYGIYNSYYYDNPVPGAGFGQDKNPGSEAAYNLLTPADYSDIVHYLPVTLSVTADFPVGQNTSLETGLSYTYLYSRYSRNDRLVYRGTLQQHYVGIPVNLRYKIWQNDTWNFYLLGGASVEKGIRAIYKQDIEQQNGVVQHTNVYNSIAGLQFSAQGGAGFSYRLQNNLQLFGEPRLIYYFKNNQPLSSRTENPVIFGLNLGVRMQFK